MNKLNLSLNPKFFFLGVILSVLGLSFAGKYLTLDHSFEDFSRFYTTLTPETKYYATANQLLTLSHTILSKDKIAVIIGGSSNSRGTGQSRADLWSSALQKELGNKYQVLNLAINGGGPGGQALYMAEKLNKEGYKVIFVSDVYPYGVGMLPTNSKVYQWMFFDALSRGYIEAYPERMNYLKKHIFANEPETYKEYRIKAKLNSLLNFDDLWAYIAYEHFYTIWTSTTHKQWKARKTYDDSEENCVRGQHYKERFDNEMSIVRGTLEAPPLTNDIDESLYATIPAALRDKTILVSKSHSPFYVKHFSKKEKNILFNKLSMVKAKYESLGISLAVAKLNFNEGDYCDREHLSESGGKKLAKYLAGNIIKKSRKLGYE